jgi:SAM-dependent methyltransferase
MALSLEEAFAQAASKIENIDQLVRVVLSGRRRNFNPEFERIDIRPVKIKDEVKYQVVESDGRQDFTKNFAKSELKIEDYLTAGYANILVEMVGGTYSLRVTKKGEALVHEDKVSRQQNLDHDRKKPRLLDPADPFLIEVGISDKAGVIKPSRQDKYIQVEEFLRILAPTVEEAISTGKLAKPTTSNPLRIVDLGCGNAYLTFAVHQYLNKVEVPTHVTGIDIRPQSFKSNTEIAKKLGITSSIEFKAESIDKNSVGECDLAIALHACDTATDDAIAWGVTHGAKILLIAPCCQHDLQTQMVKAPEPWSLLTKFGLIKERLGDLLTDSLRAQILKLKGYRTEIIEFIASDHTPRNILIRAVFTGAKPEQSEFKKYEELCKEWGVEPALAGRLNVID